MCAMNKWVTEWVCGWMTDHANKWIVSEWMESWLNEWTIHVIIINYCTCIHVVLPDDQTEQTLYWHHFQGAV